MAKARRSKQLTFYKANKVGLLGQICATLAGAGVNISALCAYQMNKRAYFMMITDSNAKAKRALKKMKTTATEEPVIVVEMTNRVGELEKVAAKLAKGDIDLQYTYGTAGSKRSTFCVLKTDNDTKAIKIINKSNPI
jgi:hypothetical protein